MGKHNSRAECKWPICIELGVEKTIFMPIEPPVAITAVLEVIQC